MPAKGRLFSSKTWPVHDVRGLAGPHWAALALIKKEALTTVVPAAGVLLPEPAFCMPGVL